MTSLLVFQNAQKRHGSNDDNPQGMVRKHLPFFIGQNYGMINLVLFISARNRVNQNERINRSDYCRVYECNS